jgi:hypothetical protein
MIMTNRNYWLDLFTGATWTEFKAAGGKVSGFRESRWNTVNKMKQPHFHRALPALYCL